MVSGVSASLYSKAKLYGDYGANFLLGTGADRIGKEIGMAVKSRARKSVGMSITKAIGTGFKKGILRNHADLAKNGGFIKNLLKTFKDTPSAMGAGWKSGTGILSKFSKSLKPLGKLMPFAMNALWLASSIPDIVARTKDEGIWGGIKEAGKAVTKMGIFSLTAAIGNAAFGLAGGFILPMATSIVVDKILGSQQTVIKPLGPLYTNCTGINSSTILGDGSVALILDVFQLTNMIRSSMQEAK